MGLFYGVDPSDVKGTLVGQLVPTLYPPAGLLLSIVGFFLSAVTLYGFASLVSDRWSNDWADGVAAFCGLIGGSLTLMNAWLSIPFWIGGLLASAM
jgi:hypothetical protein